MKSGQLAAWISAIVALIASVLYIIVEQDKIWPDTTPTVLPKPDSAQTLITPTMQVATAISSSDLIIVFATDFSIDKIFDYSGDAEARGYKPIIYKIGDIYYAIIEGYSDPVQQEYYQQKLAIYFGGGVYSTKLSEICPKSMFDTEGKYFLCFD